MNVGFTTDRGTMTAASDWGAEAERKNVRPALPGSYQALFHSPGIPRVLLDLRERETQNVSNGPLLERAIGVIYLPETERISH
jgi:erythromycin esterase-like protein